MLAILLTGLVTGCATKSPPTGRDAPTATSPGRAFPPPAGPGRAGWRDRPPVGWRKTPVEAERFRYSLETEQPFAGARAARIDGTPLAEGQVASLSQSIDAGPYRGRRVRLTAQVRHEAVVEWAHAWLTVRDTAQQPIDLKRYPAARRPGTIDWRPFEIELDVPEEAMTIAFGFVLVGPGTLWVDEVALRPAAGRGSARLSRRNPVRNPGFED